MTNYNLYKMFIVVAECKNITKASEKLYVSQPALTNQIKQLETSLGGELFVRKNKGVELTTLGQTLYSQIKPLINQLDNMEDIALSQQNLNTGILRIGANSSNCNQIIAKILISFASIYPNIKIIMKRANQKELLLMLEQNQIDIAFFDTCPVPNNIKTIKKYPVDYQLIGNVDYYNKYKDKPLSQIPTNEIILPTINNTSRTFIDTYLKQNGIFIEPKYELDNYILVYDFIKSGLGIAFVNLEFYKDNIEKHEVYPLFEDIKIFAREFSAFYNSNFVNPAKNEFISMIKKIEQ